MTDEEMSPDEQELLNALRTLAREEEGLTTPPRVEARLMQAFHERRNVTRGHRRLFVTHALKAAAIFVLAVMGGYWWSRGGAEPMSRQGQVEVEAEVPARLTSWPAPEAVVWLDSEQESLQVVRVRVASATLAAQGYAFDDADNDGVVELEVIIGEDGMARGVRVASATSLGY